MKNEKRKTWSEITMEMVKDYGCSSKKGSLLLTLSALCAHAENNAALADIREFKDGDVQFTRDHDDKIGILGYIPAFDEAGYGTSYAGEEMACRLRGIENVFQNGLCNVRTTHDLNSFSIPKIGDLIAEIRMLD